MAKNNNLPLPPDPTHAVLKKIYPWDGYNINVVTQWLYTQAQNTGFYGTFEDFKQRYGAFIEAQDAQDLNDLIEHYEGSYHVTPSIGMTQVLQTENKVLNENIIVDAIPDNIINRKPTYTGKYQVTPLPFTAQILRTDERILTENIIVEEIPYAETTNAAGGYTVTIG